MTADDQRAAVLEQLEAALNATDVDAKDFHIREATQLLYFDDSVTSADAETADEMTE